MRHLRLAIVIGSILMLAAACVRLGLHRISSREREHEPVARTPVGGLDRDNVKVTGTADGTHRLLLDAPALARLRDAARAGTQAYRFVLARADEAADKPVDSGYQGFEWADAVADCALVWHATGDAKYAACALRYLGALLDDRLRVGDGQGGDEVIRYDSGYGIRTFGAYTALAYDWLRGAPGFDQALRERALARLDKWLAWYATDGYLHDTPIANYYWGYLTTLAFAGLAAAGESPLGDRWLETARNELSTRALPAFRDELRGGGWPEGYQYGEYTTAEVALVAEAFRTGAHVDIARKLPWLADTIAHHTHALLPDQRTVYDGGTQGEHPVVPSALAVSAVDLALDGIGDARAAEGRWLVRHALPPLRREQAWVGLLAERPGAPEQSPRDPQKTSLHLDGEGLTFARSDWSPGATWVSFQAGPWLAEDHQDADQGHFELFRGSDGLLIDAGDAEGSATINHNTLLIDDGGRHLTYPPNQGVWGGDRVKTTRFGDDGAVMVAVGDIGEAYAPKCARDGCKTRTIESAVRSLVFVRPDLLFVDDRVALDEPDVKVTWAAHLTQLPTLDGDLASAVIGASRVDVRTLEPSGARHGAPREPTPSGEGSHRANKTWGPTWRLEVESPTGTRERGFLHAISVGPAASRPPDARTLAGDHLRGAAVRGARAVAVLFASGEGAGRVALGGPMESVVVAGLTPGRRYGVAVDAACNLSVTPSDAGSFAANTGGFVRANASHCGAP
ncbi:MAG TPA: heparinase II/III family protein [Polyangiaceae bacterium]|nr:heparinase II/III family protein [Polyangiaceae bacterium]